MDVDNLKLYEPSMLDQEEDHFLPSIEEFAPDTRETLEEDMILKKWSRTTRQRKHEL
jgi:hypothetical protein